MASLHRTAIFFLSVLAPALAELTVASPNSRVGNFVYLQNKTFAAVTLELPGVPGYTSADTPHKPSSQVTLSFRISPNGKHLMVNDQLLAFTVPDPSTPPKISVTQSFHSGRDSNPWKSPFLAVDYELTSRSRDHPGIEYYNHRPRFWLNLIGIESPDPSLYPYGLLLDSPEQKFVQIELRGRNGARFWSNDPDRAFEIYTITVIDRPRDYRAPLPNDTVCSAWNWRCADLDGPPWYRFVWHRNFDEFGRIGCLRREVLLTWSKVKTFFPGVSITMLLSVLIVVSCVAIWEKMSSRRRRNQVFLGEKGEMTAGQA